MSVPGQFGVDFDREPILPLCPYKRTRAQALGFGSGQIQTHAPQQKGGSIRSLVGARVRGLIRATPLSEGPQSTASRLIARPERSTQIL